MPTLDELNIPEHLQVWLIAGVAVVLAVVVALVLHGIVYTLIGRLVGRMTDRTPTNAVVPDSLMRNSRRPVRVILVLLALLAVLPGLALGADVQDSARQILSLALTAAVGWLAFSLTRIINDVVAARYDITAADNLVAREVHTRVRLLQRILAFTILVLTACLILMAIPGIRQIGVTIFASAGIAGIVAGLAARPALSNLIAGIQLALTQPIRIDDVVIVEGEWGWIEEIRMTFVVVRIWDLRRLIVPLSYFIETPFQNWTRTTADILGTVFLYTDYTVDVAKVRAELHRILQGSELWDGKVWNLQVTNTTERSMELRALMGAHNSGQAWDLRCHVREKLLGFLQHEYPDALPRLRAELVSDAAGLAAPDKILDRPRP
jgi:small-conductance mechanosensitive channel